jgi:hypothetical protein
MHNTEEVRKLEDGEPRGTLEPNGGAKPDSTLSDAQPRDS